MEIKEICLILIGIIFFILLIVSNIINLNFNDKFNSLTRMFSGFFITLSGIVFGLFLSELEHNSQPSAIDVYQNKTELQYNYQIVGNDTTITDSIVIFKK